MPRELRPDEHGELRKVVDDLRRTNLTLLAGGGLGGLGIAVAAKLADEIAWEWKAVAGATVVVGAAASLIGAMRWRERALDPATETQVYLRWMASRRKLLSWAAGLAYVVALAAIVIGWLFAPSPT